MAEINEISFETVLRSSPDLRITDVTQKNYITYFKINGHQFQTFSDRINHKNSFHYDGSYTIFMAEREHDPVEIIHAEQEMEEINNETQLWLKHRDEVLEILFPAACEILFTKGMKEFIKFVDDHLFITGEDKARVIIDRLERK